MSRQPLSSRLGRRGVAALELALSLPILLMLVLGAIDTVILLRSSMRIDRAAAETANLVARYQELHESDIAGILDAASRIAAPLVVTSPSGAVIITLLSSDGSDIEIAWQRRRGLVDIPSRLGASGTVRLPADLALDLADGQTAVVVETYARIVPFALSGSLLLGDIEPVTLKGVAVFRPRVANLARVEQ